MTCSLSAKRTEQRQREDSFVFLLTVMSSADELDEMDLKKRGGKAGLRWFRLGHVLVCCVKPLVRIVLFFF